MELSGVGGGLMLAIAATLWLAYLVPNWFKRREYLATERNAVRLQQTIRVLAETAEVPDAVRAEAAARRLASEQRAELLRGPVAVGRPAPRVEPAAVDSLTVIRRRRRTRALLSLALVGSLAIAGAQVPLLLAGGATVGAWVALLAAGVGVVSSAGMLSRISRLSQPRRAQPARVERQTSLGAAPVTRVVERPAAWTPVAVPKPLYLSRPAAPATASPDPKVELERAAQAAERALRSAQREAPPITRAEPAVASRFASMGIVDAGAAAAPDLDAVLARRRAAG